MTHITCFALKLSPCSGYSLGLGEYIYCYPEEVGQWIYDRQTMKEKADREIALLNTCIYGRYPLTKCALWISLPLWNECNLNPKLYTGYLGSPWQYLEDEKIWVIPISLTRNKRIIEELVLKIVRHAEDELTCSQVWDSSESLELSVKLLESLLPNTVLLERCSTDPVARFILTLGVAYKLSGRHEAMRSFYDDTVQYLCELKWDEFNEKVDKFCNSTY